MWKAYSLKKKKKFTLVFTGKFFQNQAYIQVHSKYIKFYMDFGVVIFNFLSEQYSIIAFVIMAKISKAIKVLWLIRYICAD